MHTYTVYGFLYAYLHYDLLIDYDDDLCLGYNIPQAATNLPHGDTQASAFFIVPVSMEHNFSPAIKRQIEIDVYTSRYSRFCHQQKTRLQNVQRIRSDMHVMQQKTFADNI